jgi:hypothetical protein
VVLKFIDIETLKSIDIPDFRSAEPFPWINPRGFLTEAGLQTLTANMPDLALFESSFDTARKSDQAEHQRYILEYQKGLEISPVWDEFVSELLSPVYRDFVTQLLGTKHIQLRMHWHYTPNGCDVSPHCDSQLKLGSQIFYLNTKENWDAEWGGQTVLLDDNGRFETYSAPGFDDFDREWVAETMDNRSIIFGRRGNSWHGVRTINAPEGALRRVFILVYQDARPLKLFRKRMKRLLTGTVDEKKNLVHSFSRGAS